MTSLIDELEQLWIDQPKETIRRAEEAMPSAKPQQLIRLCSVCGAAFRRLAELDRAYCVLLEGMALAQELNDFNAQAEILQRLASVFGDRGDFQRASVMSEQAALRFLQAGDIAGSGRALFDLGMWSYYLEDFRSTLRLCRSAFRILPANEINNRFAILQCMALAAMELDDLRRARRYTYLARKFHGHIGVMMRAKLLWLEAKLLKRGGALARAERTLKDSLNAFLDAGAYLDVALVCVEIAQIVLISNNPERVREVASSCGKLLLSNPHLGDNKLASAAIMEIARCSSTGDLQARLSQIQRRLDRAAARSRL